MSMVLAALAANKHRTAVLVHACLNEDVQAFRPALDDLADSYTNFVVHHRYEDGVKSAASNVSQGRVDAEFLSVLVDDKGADFYICGPSGFMKAMTNLLNDWSVPETQVRLEAFGPSEA